MIFDYIKCPLHRYTFTVKAIRLWVESECEGKTLNLFAGKTCLQIDEVRNDLDPETPADFRLDALAFARTWKGEKFDTVLLDPHTHIAKAWRCTVAEYAAHFDN